jgi:protoporphyrinogen oxidase
VYERSDHVGGLAASFKDEAGFTWDVGGHVQFSHYRYFDDLMVRALGDEWLHHQRESWVWIEDRFVPYPFQNNIRYLPPASRWRCLQGLIRLYKSRSTATPKDFREWIMQTFGAGLADVFMIPYNFKVWAYPPEMMGFGWVGERVAVTDLERVLDNVLHERDDLSWGPNNTFQFPKHGGTGEIWRRVAKLVGHERIHLNHEVTRIDPAAKTVEFMGGKTKSYDLLISSLPLPELTRLAGLASLQSVADSLKYSTSHIIGVGLTGKPRDELAKKCWMYFPENDCPFYRVTLFSNYSPENVPDIGKYWSLMAEVSESPHKPVNRETLIEDVVRGMQNTRLIDTSHTIASTWQHTVKYGYPTPSLERDDALQKLLPELEQLGIYSRGRFGGWKYEVSNQDHSLMQGVELINRLLLGVPEVTYPFPNTANNMRYAKTS